MKMEMENEKKLVSKKRYTIKATALAKKFGFSTHYLFVDFITEWLPDLVDELESVGWNRGLIRNYVARLQLIVEKHMGVPVYRKTSPTELANLYGYARFDHFHRIQLSVNKACISELEAAGWDRSCKKLIPLWIDIIIKHLGTPGGIEEIIRTSEE